MHVNSVEEKVVGVANVQNRTAWQIKYELRRFVNKIAFVLTEDYVFFKLFILICFRHVNSQ